MRENAPIGGLYEGKRDDRERGRGDKAKGAPKMEGITE